MVNPTGGAEVAGGDDPTAWAEPQQVFSYKEPGRNREKVYVVLDDDRDWGSE